ncbi:hypothetical protein HDU81_011092 [Chytriomyces hyalinus]|nr:hypothetical protein HDU81_011092 [Chytriomyces hyalinus]
MTPMLSSLHLRNLEDCDGIAFSEFKALKKLSISNVFAGRESPKEIVQQVVDIVNDTKIQQLEVLLPMDWRHFARSDLKRHELTIQSLQQQILDELNSYRKLLQMPLLTSIDSSILAVSKSAVSTTACPSIDTTPTIPAMHSKRLLKAMPPEILDRIASFVSSELDILQLSHAVRYFKYISKAMFDFGYPLRTLYPQRTVKFNYWPCLDVVRGRCMPTLPVPISHLHALQSYSKILSKHGGYASIDDPTGMEVILGALPESIEVLVEHVKPMNSADEFFAALYNTKKMIRELWIGVEYVEQCETDPALIDMTAKWLVKLPISELDISNYPTIPTQIQAILHLSPMLKVLHVQNLEHCAGINLSDSKSLRKLVLSNLVDGKESLAVLVQQVLDIVKGTRIRHLELAMGGDYYSDLIPSDLRDAVLISDTREYTLSIYARTSIDKRSGLEIIGDAARVEAMVGALPKGLEAFAQPSAWD